ncbi:MAG: hypothetical protein GY832_39000 [Chloroflexi bacterium]|nr:hypothetical protein [Chloroflexota bacterium]
MTDEHHRKHLLEQATHGQLTLFIGADLSRDITTLPSRAGLARDLARRHDLSESQSLAEVAQRVAKGGNRWEFTAFIRDALDTSGKSPQPFHQRIVNLVRQHQVNHLITTAYDNLLELAFQEANVPINRVVRGSDVSFITPDRPTLIKLYGDAQQPETLVVTEDDHYRLWRDRDKEDVLDEVRNVLRKQTVLFLGYNLSDPDFNLLWREVLDRAGRFARTAYAVWPGLPESDAQVWRDRGITILDTDPLGILGESAAQSAPYSRPEATIPVSKGEGESSGPQPTYGTGNRWAVLAGVNEYQDDANYGKLQTCVKDVEAIREQLVAGGFDSSRIRLLTSNAEPPTKANILVALKAVADATEPDDLLLFYYSGHGDEDGDESYLVAQDGRRLVLADTAVPLLRVREIVQEAPARAKVIVLDACHSGADIGGKGPRPMSDEFIRRVFEEAEGLAVLASCKKGQLSYEWRDSGSGQGRSVFTHFFLEALTGEADRNDKGFVTVQDASRHVTDGVKLWASQRNVSQTPTLQYTVAGDIILVSVQGGQETNGD